MATDGAINSWAAGLGFDPDLGYRVGRAFAAEHGGRLPTDRAELCAWAAATGRRRGDGTWVVELPRESGETVSTETDPIAATLPKVRAWIYQNPWSAAGIAALGYFALVGGSRLGRVSRRRRV